MKNLFSVEGKVIVITGATGILGQPISKHLLDEGAKIVLLDRNEELGVKIAAEMGDNALFVKCDVLSQESMEEAYQKTIEKFSRVDVLINMAGGNQAGATVPDDKTIYDLDMDAISRVINLNLFGTIIPTLVFSKSMAETGSGSIINISSMSALRPLTRVMGYGIAKAGVTNLTQYLAGEMAMKFSTKIRVNAIAPGFFLTDQNRALLTNSDGSHTARAEQIIQHTPFKRFGEPEELIGSIQYLASDASSFVNGEVMVIDGGFNAFSI